MWLDFAMIDLIYVVTKGRVMAEDTSGLGLLFFSVFI